MKAVIIQSDEEIIYTHNLLELANKTGLPEEKTSYFPILSTLYSGARYPNSQEAEVNDIEEILEKVEEVVEWTRKQLKK